MIHCKTILSLFFILSGCITAPPLPGKPDEGDIEAKEEVVEIVEAEVDDAFDVELDSNDLADAKEMDAPDIPDSFDADMPEINAEVIFDAELDGYDAGDTGPPVIVLKRLSIFSGSVKGASSDMKAKGGTGQSSPAGVSQNSEGSTANFGFFSW